MNTFLLFILIVITGFLSFHFLIKKLQKKLLYFTGLEFLIIGILIGEPFIRFLNHSLNTNFSVIFNQNASIQLKPIIALIIGAVGFATGLQFRIRNLAKINFEHYRLAFTDIFGTIIIISLIFFGLFYYFFSSVLTIEQMIVSSMVLGVSASTYSPTVLESLQHKFAINGSNFNSLLSVSQINNFFSILIFGLMFSIIHQGETKGIKITSTEWFVINITISILIGFLFFIFLEREENENKMMLALFGIIIFSSGAAYYLNLSPLFMNVLVGMIIGNLFKLRDYINDIFKKLEHPFYVIILIYTGANINIDKWEYFLLGIIIYLSLRILVKLFNGYLAYLTSYEKDIFSEKIGQGLNSQGILAIVIALNFVQVYNNPFSNLILSIIVISVLINEFLSTKMIKDLLIDLNEIK